MRNKKLLTLTLLLTLVFPFGIIEINAALTNIPFSGSYEIPIGQWEPWPTDYRFSVYAIPSLEGSNDITWSVNRDTISPGESLTLRIELQEGVYYLRMDFRIIIVKKSTNQVLVDETIGGYLPTFSVPGSFSSPKYTVPVFPLEEFGIPAELSVYFRLNLDTSLVTGLSATGLNPSEINENFQSAGTKSITYSKPSGVGANIDLTSTSLTATGSVIVSLGLTVFKFPTPFTVDFTSVPITDWTLLNYQQLNLAALKTPINIDFSLSRSIVNLGDAVTVNGYLTPSAQNIPLQLLVDGISTSSTQTRSDSSFSFSWQPKSPGTFSISVKALESTYTTFKTSSSKQLTVNKPPESSFRFSPLNPRVSESVQFTDESYDLDGQIVEWNWNFGDGASSSASNPTHSYSQSGSHTVRLTVTDNQGASDTYTKTIIVSKIPTSISIQTLKTQFPVGESIIISGTVDPSISGVYLTISITNPDGTKIERTITTSLDGSYEYSFKPTEIGSWSVKVSWKGDDSHQSSMSNSVTFNVLSSTGHLRVKVRDENGNPIDGATITSTSQPSGQSSLSSSTDSDGSVSFSDIQAGTYSFQASKSGYLTGTSSISVSLGERAELTITLETEPAKQEEESSRRGGIPGFPYESIILGLMVSVIILELYRRRQ